MAIGFGILGPVEARDGDSAPIKLGGPRQRAVLAILLLHANRVVPVDQIADGLYGDDAPPTALAQVRDHVSQLRKLFDGDATLETHAPGYLLRLEPDQLDTFRFEAMTEEAFAALDRGDAAGAAIGLRHALALWRGPPLADFFYEPFAQPAIARLEALQLQAIEKRIEADLMLGQGEQLVAELEELVREHPLREQLRADLMLALYRAGRQAEALDVYHDTRTVLGDELGIEASPALRELAGKLLRQEPSLEPAPILAADAAVTSARNPFKGLRPFGEVDAADFFGREAITGQLIERIAIERFVAVVGPSGSGKSSLVHAGLVPALRRGELGSSETWHIVEMSPGSHPLEELEALLLRIAVNPPASLLEQLERDERGLCRAVKRVLPADESELVLVVDQLEELFTLVADEARRAQFLTLLERAIGDPRSRLRVVVTLRADFYDRPLRYRNFAELLRDRVLSLAPLSPEELERAIAAPPASVGVSLERGLLAQIVADVLDEPGALPLLQYALTELYDHRDGATLTRSAYQSIGGVAGALATRADELYDNLTDSGRGAARQFLLQLVAIGDGEVVTRRPVDLADLGSLDVDQAALAECIDAFGASRLLSFGRDPRSGASIVEIAHESLLTEWARLHGWIDSAREAVRAQRRLTARADEWEESGRDPSLLLRGSQLVRFETWAGESGLAQTEHDRAYLQASLDERQSDIATERRAVNRLRSLVAVLAVAAIVAVGLSVFAFHESNRSQHQTQLADARQLAAASVSNLNVDPQLSILLAMQAVRGARVNGAPLPEAEDALHQAIAASRLLLTIKTPDTAAIAISPDGSRIAAAGSVGIAQIRDYESASRAGGRDASVFDAKTGRRLLKLRGITSPVHDIAYSADGSRIVTGSDNGTAIVWNAHTGERLVALPDPNTGGGFLGVDISPDGQMLATADGVGRLRIWNLATRRLARTITIDGALCDVAWSPDATLVGAGQCGAPNYSSAYSSRVWDARTGHLVFGTTGAPTWTTLRFAPDSRSLVTPTLNGTAEVWQLEPHRLAATLTGHAGQVAAVAYSPDGRFVATGGTDGTARVWDARSGKQLLVLAGHTASVDDVEFTPDGRRLVTASEDGTVRVWDITPEGSRDLLTLVADAGGVATVVFNPSGTRLLTSGECDGRTKFWNAQSGSLIWSAGSAPQGDCASQVAGQRYYPDVNATGPDGSTSAAAAANGAVHVFDASGRVHTTLAGGHQGVQAIAFDQDGKRIATGNWDGTAIVWDSATGRQLKTFSGHNGVVESVAFSPDGKLLATGGEDTTAQVWDIATGQRLLTLTGATFALTDVTFSPDGTRLATSSGDGTVRVYVLPVGQLLAVARARLRRTWTTDECRAYLPGGKCPTAGS